MPQPRSGSPKPTWPRRVLPAVGALALAGALTAAAQPPALAHPSTATTFNADLQGVDTLSATDAWAVGSAVVAENGDMILHFDGSTWSQVPAPALNQGNLYGISMASASDGWTAGTYFDQTTGSQDGVLLHWNGSTWTQVSIPTGSRALTGVDAVSASDVWAVGAAGNQAIILHYNGQQWDKVAPPSGLGTTTWLAGISASSASDVWAVGQTTTTTGGQATVALHWNGSTWSRVPTPSPGQQTTSGSELSAISDVSGTDVWAVGSYGTAKHEQKTLTLHWNGTTWTQEASPSPSHQRSTQLALSNELTGVSALPGSQAWTVGDYHASTGQTAMTLHWTGTKWVKVANPGGNVLSMLQAISMRSATDGWAVGKNYHNATAILLHWNGSTWTEF